MTHQVTRRKIPDTSDDTTQWPETWDGVTLSTSNVMTEDALDVAMVSTGKAMIHGATQDTWYIGCSCGSSCCSDWPAPSTCTVRQVKQTMTRDTFIDTNYEDITTCHQIYDTSDDTTLSTSNDTTQDIHMTYRMTRHKIHDTSDDAAQDTWHIRWRDAINK